MKQLLLRVPDETHARVTQQARQAGVSVNSYVNRLLSLGINPDAISRRDRLKLRLMEVGLVGRQTLSRPPGPTRVSLNASERDALLARVRAEFVAAGGLSDDALMSALGRDRGY